MKHDILFKTLCRLYVKVKTYFLSTFIALNVKWVTRLTDHILTNSFANTNFKTLIFKIDISDYFIICFLQLTSRPRKENKATHITKRVINNNAIEMFKQELYKTSWDDVINSENLNDAYNYFLHKLIVLYDKSFPE